MSNEYANAGTDTATSTLSAVPVPTFNIPASAPTNRKNRRALVKALGNRQFKKLYRNAP
jgi:hypothetical protein